MKVIDDFLPDPMAVRNSVMSAGFGTWRPNKGKSGADYYAGLGFYGDHAQVIEAIYKKVGMIGYPNSMVFRVTNENTEKGVIHSDAAAGDTTCFLYLSVHPEKYGTEFYSGDIENPGNAELVRGVFNRAVIFKSRQLHRRYPVNGIGTDAESGRLVWIGHFRDGVLP